MMLAVFFSAIFCCVAIGAILIGGAIHLLLGFRILDCFTFRVCKSRANMYGKVVIVTGCTSGIGKETARDLAKRGAKVIMACDDVDDGNAVKDELVKSTGNNNIVVREVDLSSLKSVRELARQINREEVRLDVLIHNAGTAEMFRKKISEDGLEMTMATNYYGPFLLTHLLIDLLKKSAPSRIVVVASEGYRLSCLNLENLNPTTTLPVYLYFVSKYANILFTLELARRLEGSGVTANCLHPGIIASGIWKNVPAPFSWPLNLMIKGFFQTPEQGAQTTIHLAVSDEVIGVNGKYFLDCHEYRLSQGAKDEAKGKKLWELSEGFVKLGPTDPKI